MERAVFEKDETYLPVTAPQFEALTNEVLTEFNKITSPFSVDANYFAETLMNVIHQLVRTQGVVKKSVLLECAINLISKHTTYHAIEALKKSLDPLPEATPSDMEDVPTNVSEVH